MKKVDPKHVSMMLWLMVAVVASPIFMGSACMVSRPKISAKASYGQNAKTFYDYAKKLLKAGNYEQSRKEFNKLKTKYPFSRYATLAEVGIADTHFEAGKFLIAIDAYKLFVKLHPTHPRAGYAAYQAAYSYDKLRPVDWFLVPPSYQKDATTTKQAIKAYKEYISEYPAHPKTKLAKQRLKICLKSMGMHEMHVGRYYQRRGKHRAVIWRMDYLLKTYPGVGLDAEARFMRAEALFRLKRYKDARTAVAELVKKHPKLKYANWGKSLVNKIPNRVPAPRRVPPKPRESVGPPAPVKVPTNTPAKKKTKPTPNL